VAERSPLIQILRTPPASNPTEAPATSVAQWPAVAERLRAYAAARPRSSSTAERCEFCGNQVDAEHNHLVDVPRRALLCVCRPCYLLFAHEGAGALRPGAERPRHESSGVRFRAVPERYALVPELAGARDAWDALQVPIGLAFFFTSSATGRTTAFYPSPAGATESELTLDAWNDVVRLAPALARMAADVEALVVRRTNDRAEAAIVPIDACYELVGWIRRTWRGFRGGDELWEGIDDFFAYAAERAKGARRD
jgi:hypothetical protein